MRFAASVMLVAMMSDVFVVRGIGKVARVDRTILNQNRQELTHQNTISMSVSTALFGAQQNAESVSCEELKSKINALMCQQIKCNSEQDNGSVDDIQNLINNIEDDGTIKINDDEIKSKIQEILAQYTIARLYAECANNGNSINNSAALEMLRILSIKCDILKQGFYTGESFRNFQDIHFNNNYPIANTVIKKIAKTDVKICNVDDDTIKRDNKKNDPKDKPINWKDMLQTYINEYEKHADLENKINILSKIIYCSKKMNIADLKDFGSDHIEQVINYLVDLKNNILKKLELKQYKQKITEFAERIMKMRNEEHQYKILECDKEKEKKRLFNPLKRPVLEEKLETQAQEMQNDVTKDDLIVLLNIESEIMQFESFSKFVGGNNESQQSVWFKKLIEENAQKQIYEEYVKKIKEFIGGQNIQKEKNGNYIKYAKDVLKELKHNALTKINKDKAKLCDAKIIEQKLCCQANTQKNKVLNLMITINTDIAKMEKEIGDIECVLKNEKQDECLQSNLKKVLTGDAHQKEDRSLQSDLITGGMHKEARSLKNKIGEYSTSIQCILYNKEHTTTTIEDAIQRMEQMKNDLSKEKQSYNLQSEIDIAKKNIVKTFIMAECTNQQKHVEEDLRIIEGNGENGFDCVDGGKNNEYGAWLGLNERSKKIETVIGEIGDISNIKDDTSFMGHFKNIIERDKNECFKKKYLDKIKERKTFAEFFANISQEFGDQKKELEDKYNILKKNKEIISTTLGKQDFEYSRDFQYDALENFAKQKVNLEQCNGVSDLDSRLGDTYKIITKIKSAITSYEESRRQKEEKEQQRKQKEQQERELEEQKTRLQRYKTQLQERINNLDQLKEENAKLLNDIKAVNDIMGVDNSNKNSLNALLEKANKIQDVIGGQKTILTEPMNKIIDAQSIQNNTQDQKSIEQLNDKIDQLKQCITDAISDRKAQNIEQGIQNDRRALQDIWSKYVDTQKQNLIQGNNVLTELNNQLKEIQESSDDDNIQDNSSSKQDFSEQISAIGEKINNLDGKTPTNADDISVQATKGKEAIDKVQDEQAKLKQQIEDAIRGANEKKQKKEEEILKQEKEAEQKRKEEEEAEKEKQLAELQEKQDQLQKEADDAIGLARKIVDVAKGIVNDQKEDQQTSQNTPSKLGKADFGQATSKLEEAKNALQAAEQIKRELESEQQDNKSLVGLSAKYDSIAQQLGKAKQNAQSAKEFALLAIDLALHEKLDKQKRDIDKVGSDINGLKDSLNEKHKALDDIKKKIAELVDQNNKLNSDLENVTQQQSEDNKNLLQQLLALGQLVIAEINGLRTSLNEKLQQFEQMKNGIDELVDRNNKLQSSLENVVQKQDKNNEDVQKISKQLDTIKLEIDREINSINGGISSIRDQLNGLDEKMNTQQQKIDTIEAPVDLTLHENQFQGQIQNVIGNQKTVVHISHKTPDPIGLNKKKFQTCPIKSKSLLRHSTNAEQPQFPGDDESIVNNTLMPSQLLTGDSQQDILSSIIQSQKDIKDEKEPNNNDTLKNIASTLAQKNELQRQLDIMNEINIFITKIKGWSQDDIDISYRDISFDFLDLIKNKKTMVRFVNDSAFAQVVQSMFSNNEGGEASL